MLTTTAIGLGVAVVSTVSRSRADAPLTIGFGGDVAFTHGLGARDPFAAVRQMLRAPDRTWVNLETTLGREEPIPRQRRFRSGPDTLALLSDAGIDGVALANNHALDFGRSALVRTMEALDASRIAHAGAGRSRREAFTPRVQTVGHRRVATLAFERLVREHRWSATDRLAGIASARGPDVEPSVAAVRGARGVADIVIVMAHWGVERAVCPAPFQRELARRWAEAGADVIVGSHPHVLQGIERIGPTWVIHSSGNLAFPSARGETARSAFFELTFAAGSRQDTTLRVSPLVLVRGAPHPASVGTSREILAALSARSFGVSFDDAGRAHVRTDATTMPLRCASSAER